MRLLKKIIFSFAKSRKLIKISKRLNPPIDNISEFFKDIDKRNHIIDSALNDLIKLCINDSNVQIVLNKYNANENTLKNLYNCLNCIHVSQWVNGHYVKASSLVYWGTLDYLLRNFKEITQSEESLELVCKRLFLYFKKNENGYIDD